MAWIPPVVTGAIAAAVQPPVTFDWAANGVTNAWVTNEGLVNDETNITWTDVVDGKIISEGVTNLAPFNATDGSHPILRCDKASLRAMQSAVFTAFDKHEVILLCKKVGLANGQSIMNGLNNNIFSVSVGPFEAIRVFADVGVVNPQTPALRGTGVDGTWMLIYTRVDTDNSFISVNGFYNGQDYTCPDPINSATGYIIAASPGFAGSFIIDLDVAALVTNNSSTRWTMSQIDNITGELISRFSGLSATWDHTTFVADQ